jgi:hypothetical protein
LIQKNALGVSSRKIDLIRGSQLSHGYFGFRIASHGLRSGFLLLREFFPPQAFPAKFRLSGQKLVWKRSVSGLHKPVAGEAINDQPRQKIAFSIAQSKAIRVPGIQQIRLGEAFEPGFG